MLGNWQVIVCVVTESPVVLFSSNPFDPETDLKMRSGKEGAGMPHKVVKAQFTKIWMQSTKKNKKKRESGIFSSWNTIRYVTGNPLAQEGWLSTSENLIFHSLLLPFKLRVVVEEEERHEK